MTATCGVVLLALCMLQGSLVCSKSFSGDDSEVPIHEVVKSLWSSVTAVPGQEVENTTDDDDRRLTLDPDAKKVMEELISSEGYPVEKYIVQTKDGFLLSLYRIPYGLNNVKTDRKRPAVYLQHGLVSSSCDWVLNFPNNSLGFILADHGYDVWMGNSRGNTYSRAHITLKPDDDKFWDWSFDEMAKYDTPAFLDFILERTGQSSVYYVGHSQGTIMAFAMFSVLPEYQEKVRLFVGLAPFISLKYLRSPVKHLLTDDQKLYDMFGYGEFAENTLMVKLMADTVCNVKKTRWVCFNLFSLTCGYDFTNFNRSRLSVYMNHAPAGSSVKAVVHFAQLYNRDQFTMYDYGSESENLKRYNTTTPPAYDLSNVRVPSILFGGPHDWLVNLKDIEYLETQLPHVKAKYIVPKWNHLDFVWALNAGSDCYPKILNWFRIY